MMDIVIPPPKSLLLFVAHLPLPPESGLLIQGASWSDEVDCWALTDGSWHRQQPALLTSSMLGLAQVAVVLIRCLVVGEALLYWKGRGLDRLMTRRNGGRKSVAYRHARHAFPSSMCLAQSILTTISMSSCLNRVFPFLHLELLQSLLDFNIYCLLALIWTTIQPKYQSVTLIYESTKMVEPHVPFALGHVKVSLITFFRIPQILLLRFLCLCFDHHLVLLGIWSLGAAINFLFPFGTCHLLCR